MQNINFEDWICLDETGKDKLRSIAENIWFFRSFISSSDDKIYKVVDQMEKDYHSIMDLIKEKP